ncbi:hypothetical protein B194_2073 [Serratia plymuthica A30]|nr:hypothetical protein B194_2073 [Serratia plymuthica A30]
MPVDLTANEKYFLHSNNNPVGVIPLIRQIYRFFCVFGQCVKF